MHNSIEMVRFAVNRMDEDMQTLSQQREKEYLLLQLLYGKQLNEEQALFISSSDTSPSIMQGWI